MADIFDRTDEIFSGLMLDLPKSFPSAKHRIGLAEICRYLADPQPISLPGLAEALLENTRLRHDYNRLSQELALFSLPMAAAAAADEVDNATTEVVRHFNGGQIRLRPSVHHGVFYLLLSWDDGLVLDTPLVLHLALNDLPLTRLPLPPFDDDGNVVLLLNEEMPSHQVLLTALRNPLSTGFLIPQASLDEVSGNDEKE